MTTKGQATEEGRAPENAAACGGNALRPGAAKSNDESRCGAIGLYNLAWRITFGRQVEVTMGPMGVSLMALVCIFGGALVGRYLGSILPEPHLSEDSKDSVKLG